MPIALALRMQEARYAAICAQPNWHPSRSKTIPGGKWFYYAKFDL
jgi:hypothetical protein